MFTCISMLWNYLFGMYATFFEQLTFLTPWYAHDRSCITGVKNVSFAEDFAYILNSWSLSGMLQQMLPSTVKRCNNKSEMGKTPPKTWRMPQFYKHITCSSRWNDVETVVSTSFQRGILVLYLKERSVQAIIILSRVQTSFEIIFSSWIYIGSELLKDDCNNFLHKLFVVKCW